MSSLIDRIEHVIKARGTNFKRVERECGLGNGTIKRWAEQSPRLDKLALVSEHLQVSLDYLVFGRSCSETSTDGDYLVFGTLRAESAPSGELDLSRVREEQGLVCDGSPLNNVEADLVAMFRLLPEEEREDVFDIVHLKYKRRLGKKAESIYWTYFDESGDEESGPAEGREARDGTA